MKSFLLSAIIFTLSPLLNRDAIASKLPKSQKDSNSRLKPRLLVLTDIAAPTREPDDQQSLIHILASADIFEIEGIISTSGYNKNGSEPLETDLIFATIDAYEQDIPNLMRRSEQTGFLVDETVQATGYWPSPAYLRSVTKEGMETIGNASIGPGKGTPGSDHIIKVADEPDTRPIYVSVWGGANTFAQAILEVKESRSAAEFAAFIRKFRVYAITDQDRGQRDPFNISSAYWLRENFKDLVYIWSETAWGYWASVNRQTYWPRYQSRVQGRGALGKLYPNCIYGVEGDTPSWTYTWPGINNLEDLTQASFGGQFAYGLSRDNVTWSFTDYQSDIAARSKAAVADTIEDQLNDFFSRMDWIAEGTGNRNPNLILNSIGGYDPVEVVARLLRCGNTPTEVKLTAQGSTDPDGHAIAYSWKQDTGTGVGEAVALRGNDSSPVTIEVPTHAAGQDIHIIVRGVDNGDPPLASYRRAIIHVKLEA